MSWAGKEKCAITNWPWIKQIYKFLLGVWLSKNLLESWIACQLPKLFYTAIENLDGVGVLKGRIGNELENIDQTWK